MKWTVVIPTWQRAETLRGLLCELGQQTAKDFEIIVVCDGNDAAMRALSESNEILPSTRWIFHPENLGLAAARNTGAKFASGEFLLFLDDDVLPSPDLIACHEAAHANVTWPLVVCGRIIEERETPYRSFTDEFMQHSWERALQDALPADSAPDLLSVGENAERGAWFGLNCSISKQLFNATGGFDPVLRSDEEMEYGLRLYRRGVLTRYAPGAVVRHRGSKDMSEYYPRCWRLSGELDAYRVFNNHERSAQTQQLGALSKSSLVARTAFRNPNLVLKFANLAEQVTNKSGSRLSFGAWARLRHLGEYWNGVRATGIPEQELTLLHRAQRPILMFHSLSVPQSTEERTYYTSPRRFRRFLAWLKMMKYAHADPKEWQKDLPGHSVMLTFDDAYDDLYTELLPAIPEWKLKPLVFVVAERIGETNDWDTQRGLRPRSLLTLPQLRTMQEHGVIFGSHSCTHPLLTSLSDDALRREVRDSKTKLEDALGASVDWFAYPFGDVDRRVRAAVAEADYRAAVTTNGGFNAWQDPLALNRIEVDDRDWLLDFALKIATTRNFRRSLWLRVGHRV